MGASARLRALLVQRRRASHQSALEHAIQQRRARWLASEMLRGIELPQITSSSVRNSLEHFDEYLDRQGIRWHRGQIDAKAGMPMDMVLSSRDTMKGLLGGAGMTLIRVYVAKERRLVNSDHEIDIEALRGEASAVRERLEPWANSRVAPYQDRGPFIVFLGPAPTVPLPD